MSKIRNNYTLLKKSYKCQQNFRPKKRMKFKEDFSNFRTFNMSKSNNQILIKKKTYPNNNEYSI